MSQLWSERYDVGAAREFVPVPSAPGGWGELLEPLAVAFERVTVVPLSAFLLVGSPWTLARGLGAPSRLARDWAFYADPALLAEPDAFFPAPRAVPDPERRPVRRPLGAPAGAVVEDLSFPSSFAPVNPALRGRRLGAVGNEIVHARWWRHAGAPRPTIVCLHGFQAGGHALNAVLFDVPWLYGLGLDVVQFQLPHHGARAGPIQGWSFLGLDVAGTAEAVAHSVWDVRALLGFLLDAGAPSVGVTGVSLGGYVAALLAGLESRLSFAVPMSPVVSLADLVHDLAPLSALMPALLACVDWDLGDVRRHMAVHTPLQHAPKLPPERLLVVGAVADRLTHPYHQRLLWEHWGRPETFWHAGAHQLHLHRREYRRALKGFLERAGAGAG